MTAASASAPSGLLDGELVVVGRILPASNHTFLARLGEHGVQCVYKPVSGERPLWDFTDGTLAAREYAAWVVSDHLGWGVVPPTVLRDGPAGPGMVQLWMEPETSPETGPESGPETGPDEQPDPVDLVPEGHVPPGFVRVLDAHAGDDQPVTLVHEDSTALRRMAVFDIVTNNTDRKGGHVLAMPDGHRYGVDHGVCFHVEDKLRTVLWGFAGQRLSAEERAGIECVVEGLHGGLRERLEELLTVAEVDAVDRRCRRLLRDGSFPVPAAGWPSIPWPAF